MNDNVRCQQHVMADDFKQKLQKSTHYFLLLSPSPSALLFCLATAGNNCPPPPRPPQLVLAFLFSSAALGCNGRSWCFINAFLLFTLGRISDRVCKNRQRIKENTAAAAAEAFCFVSCYFCKIYRLSEMSKHWRSRKQPPQRLGAHGGLLKPFFFHPFLKKKKKRIKSYHFQSWSLRISGTVSIITV